MRTVFWYFWNSDIIYDNRRLAKRGFYCMGFFRNDYVRKNSKKGQLCIRK